MSKNGTAQAKPTATPPHEQHDGRVLVTVEEMCSATAAMHKLAGDGQFVETYVKPSSSTDQRRYIMESGLSKLLHAALQAINSHRLGYPEGTICVHEDTGQMARRYWSDTAGALRWLVVDPATDDNVNIDGVEELPGGDDKPWKRVLAPEWHLYAPSAEAKK